MNVQINDGAESGIGKGPFYVTFIYGKTSIVSHDNERLNAPLLDT